MGSGEVGMPILGNVHEEENRTYTPLEKRRREEMRLKPVRYGFFRVTTEPVQFPQCANCGKEIYGQVLVKDGRTTHYYPCV